MLDDLKKVRECLSESEASVKYAIAANDHAYLKLVPHKIILAYMAKHLVK